MKNRYGILGRGISYTLSPKLHKIIFEKLHIDGEYEVIDTADFSDEESAVIDTIKRLKSGELSGINVTIPYKERVLTYLDEIDEVAREIGAVNTIKSKNGVLIGYNTDYYGIIESIKNMSIGISGEKCYIFGTGGSSKAVYKVVKEMGGIPVTVSRGNRGVGIIGYEDLKELNNLVLGVNCTPKNLDLDIEKKFRKIFDLKYRDNIDKRENVVDGLYMLVVQGIKSQEIWQNRVIGNYLEIYNKMKGD